MTIVTTEELSKVYEEFTDFANSTDEIEVSYDTINDLDPLFSLQMMRTTDKDVYDRSELLRVMFLNRTITLKKGEKELGKFFINPELKITQVFKDQPYLLLLAMNFAYGILLKKLTPSSKDS